MGIEHLYTLTVKWTGNIGADTPDYLSYERSHMISANGKPEIIGSSDPHYRGDSSKYNPEELFLSSLSSCHMLWFLHLCSDRKILIVEYIDNPEGTMVTNHSGAGRFIEVTLNPFITLRDNHTQMATLEELHILAHQRCFIANSVNFPIKINFKIMHKT